MFGNCPWNLNSSILVNSAAERQAQKRKIRNGKLPIPKLINKSAGSDVSRNDTSLEKSHTPTSVSLPDTVVIIRGLDAVDNVDNSPEKCSSIPGTAATCSVRNSFNKHHEAKNTAPKSSTIIEILSSVKHSDAVYSTPEKKGNFDDSLIQTITLEKDDGRVIKLRCSDYDNKVLTVIQEKSVSFWECAHISTPVNQMMWTKVASMPNARSNDELRSRDESNICNLHWVLSLRPSGWKAVALQIDVMLSEGLLYAVDSCGTPKVEYIRVKPTFLRNIRRMRTVLLDSSSFLLYYLSEESNRTTLRKYLLSDNLGNLMSLAVFEVGSNIESLYKISESKPVVAGIDEEKSIYLWNHSTGDLIKRVDVIMSQSFSFFGLIEDKGYLFILASDKSRHVHLLAFNISTEKWKILKTFSSNFQGSVAGYNIDDGLLLAVYEEGLVVWDIQSELQLAYAVAKKKFIPFIFPKETVFMTGDHTLFTLENNHIFKALQATKLADKYAV